tara:strand:+ start:4933 stop:5304 length:372 start_codon:yes stop_codon:yes gene_type:complete
MSIKSTIAAVAASPFLLAGAAFAGPYVNLEANGSYPDGDYTSGNLEAQIGYEGGADKFGYYVSVGPTVAHTESADDFGDVEIAGYLGGTYQVADNAGLYGEVYGATNDDDIDFSGKVGVKFTF